MTEVVANISMPDGSETVGLPSKMKEFDGKETAEIVNDYEVYASTSDGSDYILVNKHKDMPKRESNYQVDVNSSFLQSNMITDQKVTVQMLPALLLCGGLPDSGKSKVIERIFESTPKLSPGFHHYEYVATGFLPKTSIETTKTTNPDLYNYGFLCGLKQKFGQESKQIGKFSYDSSECTFSDPTLDKHLKLTIQYLQKKAEQNEMKQMIKGAGLFNVWELTINSTTLHFLHCFSGHLYNSYMWLFTDIERDRQILHRPPLEVRGNIKLRKSRLEYLLRSSQLTSKAGEDRKNVCAIFAKHTKLKRVSSEKEKLQKECQNAKKQLGVQNLVNDEIIAVDFSDCNDKTDLSVYLKQTIQTTPFEIPLSHIFLRGALYLEKSIFMRHGELKQKFKAMKCDVESAFNEFCRRFTSFGSILDVSLVNLKCEIVIIKPEEFLSKLDKAFNPEKIDAKLWKEGIITETSVVTLFGEEGDTFIEVLEAVGLVTDVTNRCSSEYANCGRCFYMPSIRKHDEKLEYSQNSVQLKTSIRFPSVNLVIAITEHLLKNIPNSWLQPTVNSNVTQICSENDGVIEIIYQGGVIEFIVTSPTAVPTIIHGCEEIAKRTQQANRFGDPRYHFAVRCAKDTHLLAHNFSRKEHILPNDDLCKTCLQTEVHPNTKAWINALNENPINDDFKLDGDLTPVETLMLAKKIAKYPEKAIKNFELELKDTTDQVTLKGDWESLLIQLILKWKEEYIPKGSTKMVMTEILLKLHYQFKELRRHPDYPEYDKVGFKELARTLDLQDLTIDETLMLAKKIAKYPEKAIKNFELELKGTTDQVTLKRDWETLLIQLILKWKEDYSPKGSTKKVMTEILLKLHYQFKELRHHPDYPEYDKVGFKELARTLDLQALTYKQIQHLHASFIEKATRQEIERLTCQLKDKETIIKNLQTKVDNQQLIIKNSEETSGTVAKEMDEIKAQCQEYKQRFLKTTNVFSYLPKLEDVLQPIGENWEQLGHQLNIHQSILTDIRSKGDSNEQMKYLLEEWALNGGTLTQLADAPLCRSMKDVHSDVLALQETHSAFVDIEIQVSTHLDTLHGVCIGGKKLFLIQGDSPQHLNWEDYGLRITVPQGTLSPTETCGIAVTALVGGQFLLPEGTQLISAVYAISTHKSLLKPLRLELQHCVNLKSQAQANCLKFVRASLSAETLPYQFSLVAGGEFSVGSSYGSITKDHFCLMGVVGEMENQQSEEDETSSSEDNSVSEDTDLISDNEVSEDDEKATSTTSSTPSCEESDKGTFQSSGLVASQLKTLHNAENTTTYTYLDDEKSRVQTSSKESTYVSKSDSRGACATTSGNKVSYKKSSDIEESSLSVPSYPLEGTQTCFKDVGSIRRKIKSTDLKYIGLMYHKEKALGKWLTIFTVSKDLNALQKYIRKKHPNAEEDQSFMFRFAKKSHSILLKLPEPQQAGWKVEPHIDPCDIQQEMIDKYGSDSGPAECLLTVIYKTGPNNDDDLHYGISLCGITPTRKVFINLSIKPSDSKTTGSSIASAGAVVSKDDDTVSKIRGCINDVLVSMHDDLNQLPRVSLKMLADKLYASQLIGEPALNPCSIDVIIEEFKSILRFSKTLGVIEDRCKEFLKAFTDVGGGYATAAVAIKREFTQKCKSEVGVELHLTC